MLLWPFHIGANWNEEVHVRIRSAYKEKTETHEESAGKDILLK